MKWPKKKPVVLQEDIDYLVEDMESTKPDTDEYKKKLDRLIELKKAQNFLLGKDNKRHLEVNATDLIKAGIGVIGGIAQILIIMHYEELSNFTTKAFGFINKPKV